MHKTGQQNSRDKTMWKTSTESEKTVHTKLDLNRPIALSLDRDDDDGDHQSGSKTHVVHSILICPDISDVPNGIF
jgi:hypothetical protein